MSALRREPIGITQWQRISLGNAERKVRERQRRSAVAWVAPRNGAPLTAPYVYGAPRPDWALRAIAEAEAEHGLPPEPCMGRPRKGGG